MISIEELQPGTRIRGNVNGAEMEIIKIQGQNAVIMDIKNRNTFCYGLEALRRCDITILQQIV